jgi:hypothetical protein
MRLSLLPLFKVPLVSYKVTVGDLLDVTVCVALSAVHSWWRGGSGLSDYAIGFSQGGLMMAMGMMVYNWFIPLILTKRSVDFLEGRKREVTHEVKKDGADRPPRDAS